MSDQFKEPLVIVGSEAWIRETVFLEDVEAIKLLMVQTVSVVRVHGCFQEGSDQEGLGSYLHIEQAKTTINCTSIEY